MRNWWLRCNWYLWRTSNKNAEQKRQCKRALRNSLLTLVCNANLHPFSHMSEWAFRSLTKSSPHSLVKSCSFFFFKFPGKNWAKHFHGASGFETNKDKNCHISLVSCLSRALNSFLYLFSSKEIILQTFFLLGMPRRISKPGSTTANGNWRLVSAQW